MIREIFKKELRLLLLSGRFILSFVAVAVIFLLGVFFYLKDYSDELADYRMFMRLNSSQRTIESYIHIVRPNALKFCAENGENNLPDVYRVDADGFVTAMNSWRKARNILFFDPMDWTFIVAIVISLIAIVLSYDAFTSDKESGRLSLIFSNPIKRIEVLAGNFFGVGTSLCILFLGNIMISLLILIFFGSIEWTSRAILQLLGFIIIAILYVLLFALIGTISSVMTYRSSMSLLFSFLFWIVFVVILPTTVPYILANAGPSPRSLVDSINLLNKDFEKKFSAAANLENLRKKLSLTENEAESQDILRRYEAELQRLNSEHLQNQNKIKDDYQKKTEAYVRKGEFIAQFSPAGLFSHIAGEIIGTGYPRWIRISRQLENFGKRFSEYNHRKKEENASKAEVAGYMTFFIPDRSNPGQEKLVKVVTGYSYQNVKFDLTDIPIFSESLVSLGEIFNNVAISIFVLATFAILFFMILLRIVQGYDIR